MHFISEINILQQYSKTQKKDSVNQGVVTEKFIEAVTQLANEKSLVEYICKAYGSIWSYSSGHFFYWWNWFRHNYARIKGNSSLKISPLLSHRHLYKWYKGNFRLERKILNKEDEVVIGTLHNIFISFFIFS